jgi:acetoin utilization deacetylase AcuC-like enzyme
MSVGYVSDIIYQQHDTNDHVEGKDRLTAIETALEKAGVKEQIQLIQPRPATIDEIAAVHDMGYLQDLKKEIDGGGGWLDPDTYVSRGSWDAALYAAGGLMNAVDSVMSKKHSSAFALVRPPGHHAVHMHQMGFCLFNNVSVAARFALNNYNIKRIMIIDFDVHHGNGTQEAFYTDQQVLYCSTHEYPWYPFTGRADETGDKAGHGCNLNIPMEADVGDREYLRIFNEVIAPAAKRYKPDLMLVSAGYDAHWKDTISNINLTTTGYARIARIIKGIADECCDGRMVCTLEGGYHRAALAFSVAATFEMMLGHDEVIDPFGEPPATYSPPDFDGFINMLRDIHKLN